MPEFVPRALAVLTAIVAILAVYVGVRAYIEKPKDGKPQTSATVPTVVHSNEVRARKTPLTNTSRAHFSEAADVPRAHIPVDDREHSLIKSYFGNGGAAYDPPKSPGLQTVDNDVNAILSSPACVPLPNSTKPGDVDAPYYQNWAREYGCNAD